MAFLFGVISRPHRRPGKKLNQSSPASSWERVVALLALVGFLSYESRRREPVHRSAVLPQHPVRVRHRDRGVRVRRLGCVPVHDVAVSAGLARLFGDAHRPALSAGCHRRAHLFAVVGPAGRPLRGRPSLVVAGALLTTATLMLTLTATTPVWQLLAIFAVFGIGFSMVNAPITTAAVSGMPQDRAGAASAVASTSRQVGVSLGVALCGSIAGAALAAPGADFVADARPLWLDAPGSAWCSPSGCTRHRRGRYARPSG